jgi:N,N'-diacetyllegionaminate synthase
MLFIAEIGLNHNGNFGLIHALVREAKQSGSDIAKFQLGWRAGEGEINRIDAETLRTILKICDYYEIEPMFSIFTQEAWDLLRPHGLRRYKIASRTVRDDPALVERILDDGKETFVSMGFYEGEGLPFAGRDNVRYLWCKSLYPTPPWALQDLPKDFAASPYAGYSDHTVGIETALLAISRGARVIERHFTLDRSDVTIRDHALSSTPAEFAQLVRLGRGIARLKALGV